MAFMRISSFLEYMISFLLVSVFTPKKPEQVSLSGDPVTRLTEYHRNQAWLGESSPGILDLRFS
jgi:hypothetical protein